MRKSFSSSKFSVIKKEWKDNLQGTEKWILKRVKETENFSR